MSLNDKSAKDVLNGCIKKGASFIPNLNDFEIIHKELIDKSEQLFIDANPKECLFTLQFAALWKYTPKRFDELQKTLKTAKAEKHFELTKEHFDLAFPTGTATEQTNDKTEAL